MVKWHNIYNGCYGCSYTVTLGRGPHFSNVELCDVFLLTLEGERNRKKQVSFFLLFLVGGGVQTSKFSFKHGFRISVFHRGSASGIYRTLLWWVVLYLPFIYQSARLRCGFGSLIFIFVLFAWNGWSMILWSEYWFLEFGIWNFFVHHWYHIYLPNFDFY